MILEVWRSGSTAAKVALAIACLALLVAIVACGPRPNPCAQLPVPNQAQIDAAKAGAEVELEVGQYECVVDPNSGTWVLSND